MFARLEEALTSLRMQSMTMRKVSIKLAVSVLALLATLFATQGAATALTSPAVSPVSYIPIAAGTLVTVLSGDGDKEAIRLAPFAMRETPVSNRELQGFLSLHPEWQRDRVPATFADASYLHHWASALDPGIDNLPDQPATSVSWFAAQAFCESEQARLPTWYEWEYVAAADATHNDARKDPAWRSHILAWYAQASTVPPHSVGGNANVYGVRDMHGLIWEWVDDFNALLVSADSRTQGDPDQLQFCGAGAISLQDRENYAVLMRIALLSSLAGADTTNNLGWRCVRPSTKESK